jgi:hypothetical protein
MKANIYYLGHEDRISLSILHNSNLNNLDNIPIFIYSERKQKLFFNNVIVSYSISLYIILDYDC